MTFLLKGDVYYCLDLTVKDLFEKRTMFKIDSEAVEKFLKELMENKDDVKDTKEAMCLHILTIFTNVKTELSTRDSFYTETNQICIDERKNGSLKNILSSYKSFKECNPFIQKNIVSQFLRIFIGYFMVRREVGVDFCAVKHDEKKQKDLKKLENVNSAASIENTTTYRSPFADLSNSKIKKNLDVLRHVAGFTVRSLMKKKCPEATLINIIQSKTVIDTDLDFEDESHEWVEKLSRGGLIKVTDEYFQLANEIKKVSDLFYLTEVENNRNRDLKTITIKHILQINDIRERWRLICPENEEKWLLVLLDSFLNTRGKCLVKDLLEHFQHDTKETLKAQKALRKALKEKTNKTNIEEKSQKQSDLEVDDKNIENLPSPSQFLQKTLKPRESKKPSPKKRITKQEKLLKIIKSIPAEIPMKIEKNVPAKSDHNDMSVTISTNDIPTPNKDGPILLHIPDSDMSFLNDFIDLDSILPYI